MCTKRMCMLYSDCNINDFRFSLRFQYNGVYTNRDFFLFFSCARITNTCDIAIASLTIRVFSESNAASFPHPVTLLLFSWARFAHTGEKVIAALTIFVHFWITIERGCCIRWFSFMCAKLSYMWYSDRCLNNFRVFFGFQIKRGCCIQWFFCFRVREVFIHAVQWLIH